MSQSGKMLILETKGEEGDQDRAKYQAARRWVTAVNNWGRLGEWSFLVCRDPALIPKQIAQLAAVKKSIL
jgi:type III restriction enzyme